MRLRRKNSTVRRGYLREAPLKKRGFKKLAVDCKKILEVLREEGPCGYGKLKEKTKIPKGTLDRRLSFLKNLGLIVSEKRKWMLVAHGKTYKNIDEYKIHLGHSRKLVKGILAINEFLPQFLTRHDFYVGDILTELRKKLKVRSSSEMWPYALQHLKTGYPDTFNLFEKCSSLLEEIQDIETEITGETWEKFAKELPDIQSAELEEELSAERTNNIYKKSESTSILTEEERFKLDKQTHEARMELEDQLTKIIWKVVNGEPLSGRCNQCPEVDIGKKSESLHKDSRARD